MICSMCHKNQAAIFSSKITPDGKREMEGLCIDCAKKQGINTDEILNAQNQTIFNNNANEMNKQLEGLFKSISENLGDIDGIELGAVPLSQDYQEQDDEDLQEEQPKVFAGAIPLGSIFGNIFGGEQKAKNSSEEISGSNVKRKVKPEKKKPKNKKKKYLDVYGTNLTFKAQNNELDIVIGREGPLRVVTFKNYVNDVYLNSYNADGIIIATPTGSTGYSLSCGGPIVSPNAAMTLMTPIAPHTLNTRSIIFPEEDVITVELGEGRRQVQEQGLASFDGDTEIPIVTGDRIVIQKASASVKILKLNHLSFVEVLRQKME